MMESPEQRATGPDTGTGSADARPAEQGSIRKSLMRVDWLVLLAVGLYAMVPLAPPSSPRLLYATIALFTIFVLVLRSRFFPVRGTGERIALSAAAMVAFITVAAIQTGGTKSPLVNLYLLPIVVAAMTLGARGASIVFVGVLLAYLSVILGDGPFPKTPDLLVRLFGELGPYALVAYLTQILASSVISARRRIEEMAERDSLTGMLNLRAFRALLHREHELRSLIGSGYGILIVDMDQLKPLNDEHGHQAGNRAITTVAAAIQRAIRTSDCAARYGGDEFVLFLPEATPDIAETVAQRVRNSVYKSLFPVGERLQRMTVSVGAASYPRDGRQYDDIIGAADLRMQRDKELRRRNAADANASES
ncbi:MAG: GGDEF domain-containing protein [Steroidobacteraceae bacterium]